MSPYRPYEHILLTDLSDSLVLVDSRTGHSYHLNATARAVWLGLPGTVQDIAEAMVCSFEVSPDRALEDAQAVLDDLASKGLVER